MLIFNICDVIKHDKLMKIQEGNYIIFLNVQYPVKLLNE